MRNLITAITLTVGLSFQAQEKIQTDLQGLESKVYENESGKTLLIGGLRTDGVGLIVGYAELNYEKFKVTEIHNTKQVLFESSRVIFVANLVEVTDEIILLGSEEYYYSYTVSK